MWEMLGIAGSGMSTMPSMDAPKELIPPTASSPSTTVSIYSHCIHTPCSGSEVVPSEVVRSEKDVTSSKISALDRERFEVACLRQDIIDEYEQKSRELLDYLFKLETEFKCQQQEYEQREAVLRHENRALKVELSRAGGGSKFAKRCLLAKGRRGRVPVCESEEMKSAWDVLSDETRKHEWKYRREHQRAEELKAFVDELQLELQRAEEIAVQRKKRMEQCKKRMELENQELRRKAALGWMLGCLSELYLRMDPKVGGAGIMKLVRKVQRELESRGQEAIPLASLDSEALQGELHRLIGSSHRGTPFAAAEPCNVAAAAATTTRKESEGAKPLWSSTTTFGDEDYLEESPRRRRKQWQKWNGLDESTVDVKRPATSPSIFEDVHEDKSRKPASERNLWAETHAMDAAQFTTRECMKAETLGLLKGLEKSMSFLLTKAKRRAWC